MMRALTLIRPWPWAIFHGAKDIENRTWAPPQQLLAPGDTLAIHAGLKWDDDAIEWMEEFVMESLPPKDAHPTGCIVGAVTFLGTVTVSGSPWFLGPVGWRIDEPRALPEPIPCRGALGLWALPPAVEATVRRQLRLL